MDQGKLSVASVAVDVAREVFDTFADKTVLVIGAGKMGDLTLQHLKALNPGRILITNRNPERAEAAAARWGGRAVPFERLGQALIEADLVVSTTAADRADRHLDQYVRVQRARRNRLSLILDIAIPRDFDPRIGDLDQVTLYNVDDLRAQAEQNRPRRQKGVDPALVIIERETAACYAALRHQQAAGALLQQLGNHADADPPARAGRASSPAAPTSTEADREAIAHMAMRLQNQFLHHPRAAVRSAVTESTPRPPPPPPHRRPPPLRPRRPRPRPPPSRRSPERRPYAGSASITSQDRLKMALLPRENETRRSSVTPFPTGFSPPIWLCFAQLPAQLSQCTGKARGDGPGKSTTGRVAATGAEAIMLPPSDGRQLLGSWL